MTDGLVGPRAKIERAKKHIRELQAADRLFWDSNPYTISIEEDSNAGQHIYYVSRVTQPPAHIATIAGDVLHNLRSALDHLAHRLVYVGRGHRRPKKRPSYPIANSAAEYPAFRDRKIRGARPEAIKAIDATKPYRGGNDALWRLHHLNIIDKHRLLVTVCAALDRIHLGPTLAAPIVASMPLERQPNFSGSALAVSFGDVLSPLKEGDKLLAHTFLTRKVDEHVQFFCQIAFDEPEISQPQALIETLQHMADFVDHLISSFAPLV